MTSPKLWQVMVLIAPILFFTGCGGSARQAEEQAASGAGSEKVDGAFDLPAGTHAPQTADAAVRAAIDGFSAGRPEAIWDFLPPLVQGNVNALFRECGNRMDPELWERVIAVSRKLVGVMKSKKDFILASPFLRGSESFDPEDVATHWDDTVELLDTLVHSELSDLESLKTFEGRAFLIGSGGRMLGQLQALSEAVGRNPFGTLEQTQVTLVNAEETRATVRIDPPDDEPREVEFILMEEKWVPAEMLQLNLGLVSLKSQITAVLTPERLEEFKKRWMPDLQLLEEGLDKLQQAETGDEFNTITAQAIMPLLLKQMMRSAPQPTQPAEEPTAEQPAGPTGPQRVTVVVDRELDDAAEELVATQLLQNVDHPELGLVRPPEIADGTTRIEVSPVVDLRSFAGRIRFGTVTEIDEQARVIFVELKSDRPSSDADPADG